MKLESEQIRRLAHGRWRCILSQLAPELGKALERTGRHVPCPVHGGKDGFRLFRDVSETGGGICNTCGAYPDGLALLQWLKGWSFPETLEAISGVFSPELPRPEPKRKQVPTRKEMFRLKFTWRGSIPADHAEAKPLHRYLVSRGLDPRVISGLSDLRFHPALPYYWEGRELGRFPALVALVRDRRGRPVTIHRTYLTQSGSKAPVPEPKKLMPVISGHSVAGGAVLLGQPGRCLGIAEGIETALAVRSATGMVVWPTLSAAFMEKFDPPSGIDTLVAWADKDLSGTGERAAETLRTRMRERQIQTYILAPGMPIPKGQKSLDWLDVLNRFGLEQFKSNISISMLKSPKWRDW